MCVYAGTVRVSHAHMMLRGHRSIVNQVRYNKASALIISSGVEKIIKACFCYVELLDVTYIGRFGKDAIKRVCCCNLVVFLEEEKCDRELVSAFCLAHLRQDNFFIIFVSPETDFATPFFSEQFYQCIEQFVLQLVQC